MEIPTYLNRVFVFGNFSKSRYFLFFHYLKKRLSSKLGCSRKFKIVMQFFMHTLFATNSVNNRAIWQVLLSGDGVGAGRASNRSKLVISGAGRLKLVFI